MPYIPPARREALDPTADAWSEANNAPRPAVPPAQNAGELNFQITRLVDQFIKHEGANYSTINEAIGVLECAKLELYRRVAAPYESAKIATHGDVYECLKST